AFRTVPSFDWIPHRCRCVLAVKYRHSQLRVARAAAGVVTAVTKNDAVADVFGPEVDPIAAAYFLSHEERSEPPDSHLVSPMVIFTLVDYRDDQHSAVGHSGMGRRLIETPADVLRVGDVLSDVGGGRKIGRINTAALVDVKACVEPLSDGACSDAWLGRGSFA